MPRQATQKKTADQHDALALLKQDHRSVEGLFAEFEKASKAEDDAAKGVVVERICAALSVHAAIEEEIFYPAVRDAIATEDTMDEAEVEHEGIKRLVEELKTEEPGADMYDARVTVLAEYVKHHVKEEESEMFPKVRKSDLDLDELGRLLAERKSELEGEQD
jgi:hemerythrin superfamily protein